MTNLGALHLNSRRTRRNVVKMGAILTAASVAPLATAKQGAAKDKDKRKGDDIHCLLRGTTIKTADGDRKIEELVIGDLLPTMFGGLRAVRWIARYPFKKSDPSKPWVKAVLPVLVARSALAPGIPHTDLYLTGEHALFIDGVLIPVGNLINGTTIKLHQAHEHDELEYFNIKLDSHDVIYAEGAPVETLLELEESAVNFADYFRAYGGPKTEERRCAPFASYAGRRGELKSRVRSAISPWLDQREPIDVIRDQLEERAIALSRHLEPLLF
jgi:Hint domain